MEKQLEKIASFEEMRGIKKAKRQVASFDQLRSGRDPVFGASRGKKVPLTEKLEPVLRGYRKIEEVMPKDQRAAFDAVIENKDNPDEYRQRVTASMLMAESGPFDYKTIMGDFDNIAKTRFKKKITAGQIVDKLSPYKRLPAFEAAPDQNWFTRAYEAIKEKISGGSDIGYYQGDDRFSKQAARGPIEGAVLGKRPFADQSKFVRKSAGEAVKHGISQAGVRMTKSLAGTAQMVGDATKGLDRYETGNAAKTAQWGRLMAEAADAYYAENPAEAMQLQSNTGLVGTTLQFIKRPELLLQGLVETAPMLMEAYLGHVTGTKAAAVVGKGAKVLPWAGRVTAIGAETFGSTYSDARI